MIKKDMTIGEIIEKDMKSAEIMGKHGLHCIGCRVAVWETLEEGCKAHGFDDEQIDLLVKEINEHMESKR